MSWQDCKNSGPWEFTEQPDKWGYLPNPRWSSQQDAIDFCKAKGLSLDLPNQHLPCGHWHKTEVPKSGGFPSGRWVAAMQQPNTPYIYLYDITYKAVIKIDTSVMPVVVVGRLEIDPAYKLEYDRGHGAAQRGGYCMDKSGARIWYLFREQSGDYLDAELFEIDISRTTMTKIKSTHFSNLMSPSDNEWLNDGCSDNTHTYWCTSLRDGRIIKIRNSDHSIIDDHNFNNLSQECSGEDGEPIQSIDYHNGKLYWVYTRGHTSCSPVYAGCRHFIKADTDLSIDIDDVICGSGFNTPAGQNWVRIHSNCIFHHRAYHPSSGYLMKRSLEDCTQIDEVLGTDGNKHLCFKNHISTALDRPTTGANWWNYWDRFYSPSGSRTWQSGKSYTNSRVPLNFLMNTFGVKSGNAFALAYANTVLGPGFLYCLDFSDLSVINTLDVSWYCGHGSYLPVHWHRTYVSARNEQTNVIALFRYSYSEYRNYAACFEANSDFDLLCDVPLSILVVSDEQVMSDEPQIWPMPE